MIPDKITPEFVAQSIEQVDYIIDEEDQKYIVCVITVENGFKIEGVAHRQFSVQHNEDKAKEAAYLKAVDKLWAYYAFLAHSVHKGTLSE